MSFAEVVNTLIVALAYSYGGSHRIQRCCTYISVSMVRCVIVTYA
jgi:hypothetical protein